MTPGLSYLIPLFMAFQWLGLVGTIPALLITHLVITIPIIVWIMIGYFENVPQELEDAALVDGCSPWQSFRHIALPLAKPGIAQGCPVGRGESRRQGRRAIDLCARQAGRAQKSVQQASGFARQQCLGILGFGHWHHHHQ